jgi:hypothetical protein
MLSITQTIQWRKVWWLVNNEVKRTWKKTVLAQFEVFAGGTAENNKISVRGPPPTGGRSATHSKLRWLVIKFEGIVTRGMSSGLEFREFFPTAVGLLWTWFRTFCNPFFFFIHGAHTHHVTPRTKGFWQRSLKVSLLFTYTSERPLLYTSAKEGKSRQYLLYPVKFKGQKHNDLVSVLCYCVLLFVYS